MKTTATKLIKSLHANHTSTVEINPATILLAVLGYEQEKFNRKPPKHVSFNLTTMAKDSDINALVSIMGIAGYPKSNGEYPALVNMGSSKDVLKNYKKVDLERMVDDLLTQCVTDPESVAIDQILEVYAIAKYLRKKKVTKIIVVVSAVVIAALVTAALLNFMKHDDAPKMEEDDTDLDDDIIEIDDGVIDVDLDGDEPSIDIDNSNDDEP